MKPRPVAVSAGICMCFFFPISWRRFFRRVLFFNVLFFNFFFLQFFLQIQISILFIKSYLGRTVCYVASLCVCFSLILSHFVFFSPTCFIFSVFFYFILFRHFFLFSFFSFFFVCVSDKISHKWRRVCLFAYSPGRSTRRSGAPWSGVSWTRSSRRRASLALRESPSWRTSSPGSTWSRTWDMAWCAVPDCPSFGFFGG